MTIDEIYDKQWNIIGRYRHKAILAREKARAARKKGDNKAWSKYHAVARAYEMVTDEIRDVAIELTEHLSHDYLDKEIPF